MLAFNTSDFVAAIIGGVIISVALALNLYLFGKNTNNSSIITGFIHENVRKGFYWKFAFIAGIYSGSYMLYRVTTFGVWTNAPGGYNFTFFDSDSVATSDLHWGGWILAGFAVGIGSRLLNQDIEGLAFAGVSRLNPRSLIGLVVVLLFAFASATFKWYADLLNLGTSFGQDYVDNYLWQSLFILIVILAAYLYSAASRVRNAESAEEMWEMIPFFVIGVIYGIGFAFSGLCRRSLVTGFLTLNPASWNANWIYIVLTVTLICFILFNFIVNVKKNPLFAQKFDKQGDVCDANFFLGAVIFGLGWGFGGLSPVTGLIDVLTITTGFIWLSAFLVGNFVMDAVQKQGNDNSVTYVSSLDTSAGGGLVIA